jgi:tetraacyldisaccharide 4'-kinase
MNLKKPKFWDYKKPNIYAYCLQPLAYILQIINSVKLLVKIKKQKFKIKTICIGNIYIGGTGKTSLSIKINEILNSNNIRSCLIKKFYNSQIDEKKILEKRGKVFSSFKRIDAINQAENEKFDVAILDDGLQDHTLKCDINFVCFNNLNWVGNGLTIPAGPLRESIENLKKYQHIFINGNNKYLSDIKKDILKINPNINIHVGIYQPLNLHEFDKNDNYLVFSGIGNHETFISMIKEYGLNISKDIEFPDHYKYTGRDIEQIIDQANVLKSKIITTEKDYLRLENYKPKEIKFIKSTLKIIDEKKLINTIIKSNETN